jgi:hypothetical protein
LVWNAIGEEHSPDGFVNLTTGHYYGKFLNILTSCTMSLNPTRLGNNSYGEPANESVHCPDKWLEKLTGVGLESSF